MPEALNRAIALYNQMLSQLFVLYSQTLKLSNQILARPNIDRSFFIIILMMLIFTVVAIVMAFFIGLGFHLNATKNIEKALLTK
ncbi:MAG: hypothetical protein E6J34_15480 [Chloroflexi bacterium]|nr:MAG: hypothetical protein E6J34_15480 [Chloroflexota bacterium]